MNLLQKIKRDLKNEFKASIAFIKESAAVVKKKAKEASIEEKRRYALIDLKTKVQEQMTVIGGRVYDLSLKNINPLRDKKVQVLLNKIKKLEQRISKLEKQSAVPIRKLSKNKL
ncbi:MAG: hypothetical protein A2Y97_00710 [Nitrospirae bacterium RBG_13_39_12]|nr:MAG: hypothetical protein A2Y97_00710 [Nitrospirae bacterium RBG_13_39_12]